MLIVCLNDSVASIMEIPLQIMIVVAYGASLTFAAPTGIVVPCMCIDIKIILLLP